jgi:putative tricarboxylic transport membrane protein
MTVRTAELVAAIVTALMSIGLMIKAAELNIGWVEGRGPGAGAWPFWLAAGMLGASIATLVRWKLRITPESRSEEPFMSHSALIVVGASAGALLMFLLVTQFLGLYVGLILFTLVYIKLIGGHGWAMTLAFTILCPIFVFCLFEWALQIPLPKGPTEPLFYPIYDFMYS